MLSKLIASIPKYSTAYQYPSSSISLCGFSKTWIKPLQDKGTSLLVMRRFSTPLKRADMIQDHLQSEGAPLTSEATEDIERMLSNTKNLSSRILLLQKLRRWDVLKNELEQQISTASIPTPLQADLLSIIGQCNLKLKNLPAAMDSYIQAIKLQASPTLIKTAIQSFLYTRKHGIKFAMKLLSDPSIAYIVDSEPSLQTIKRDLELAHEKDELTSAEAMTRLLPESWVTWYRLGVIQEKHRRIDQAIKSFEECLVYRPKEVLPLYKLSVLYDIVGKKEQGNKYMYQIIENNIRDDAASCYYLALCYDQIGREDNVLELCGKAIELNPNYPQPYQLRATILYDRSQYEEALSDLRKAYELLPNDVQTILRYARVLARTMRYKEASRIYSRFTYLQPYYPNAHIEFAEVLLRYSLQESDKMNKVPVSIQLLSKAIKHAKIAVILQPRNARAHFTLAWLFLVTGESDSAKKEVKLIKEIDPSYPFPPGFLALLSK